MEIMGQLAAVGAVLALLAAALWWLKRRGIALPLPARAVASSCSLRTRASCTAHRGDNILVSLNGTRSSPSTSTT